MVHVSVVYLYMYVGTVCVSVVFVPMTAAMGRPYGSSMQAQQQQQQQRHERVNTVVPSRLAYS